MWFHSFITILDKYFPVQIKFTFSSTYRYLSIPTSRRLSHLQHLLSACFPTSCLVYSVLLFNVSLLSSFIMLKMKKKMIKTWNLIWLRFLLLHSIFPSLPWALLFLLSSLPWFSVPCSYINFVYIVLISFLSVAVLSFNYWRYTIHFVWHFCSVDFLFLPTLKIFFSSKCLLHYFMAWSLEVYLCRYNEMFFYLARTFTAKVDSP